MHFHGFDNRRVTSCYRYAASFSSWILFLRLAELQSTMLSRIDAWFVTNARHPSVPALIALSLLKHSVFMLFKVFGLICAFRVYVSKLYINLKYRNYFYKFKIENDILFFYNFSHKKSNKWSHIVHNGASWNGKQWYQRKFSFSLHRKFIFHFSSARKEASCEGPTKYLL